MIEPAVARNCLHMLQAWLDVQRLGELARALRLPVRQADHNYLVHCALGEIFGQRAPRPFCIEGQAGRHTRVLAYAECDAEELHAIARAGASPLAYSICDWPRLCDKRMPASFARGTQLDFELRACPVVRKSSAGKHHKAGAEVDAFLARVWEVDDPDVPIDREQVYCEWLGDYLRRSGGARPLATRMVRFSLERMLRRSGQRDRRTTVIKRPAVTLSGQLQVDDPAALNELLRRGIGRHTAFGFGMLKLRPPRS